jgi:Flp pilus assembly protein TadG
MRSLRKVWGDEKGASIVFVAIALVVILGFAVLAIDASMMQLAKTQLQNAADAAALAGAMAWARTNMGNQDSARAEAIRVAGLNMAVQDIQRPVLNPDVYTLDLPNLNMVTVTTYRTKAHNDPVTLYFLKVLDPLRENKGNVTAKATAKVFSLSGTNCLRPFCPPDRWFDADSNGTWDPENGDYYDPEGTGYVAPRDIGAQVILSRKNPSDDFGMFNYYVVDFPPKNIGNPIDGDAAVREWIKDCRDPSVTVSLGDQLQIEPGKAVGPVTQGLEYLYQQDEGAYWNEVTKTVEGSIYAVSPRIIKAAAFDPRVGPEDCGSGKKCVTVIKLLVVFIEGHVSDNITGRFMRMATEGEPCLGPDCPQGFVYKVALVK